MTEFVRSTLTSSGIENLLKVPNGKNISWDLISSSFELSESDMRKLEEHLNWNLIAKHQNVSRDFAHEFYDKFDAIEDSKHFFAKFK